MINRVRIDIALVDKGYASSREKAKAIVMSGKVFVNNEKVDKAGFLVKDDDTIYVVPNKNKYVSRGGYKLEKMLTKHEIDLSGKICMDIGASTGGFTDCMLAKNADLVYCVDVGYGQLDWKLRNHSKVVNLERTNARYLTSDKINHRIDFCSVDVSFISVKLILGNIFDILSESGEMIVLIKPQFEVGKNNVGKKGVVRDKNLHLEVITSIYNFCREIGFYILDLDYSPIKGPQGNIEYLIYLSKCETNDIFDMGFIEELVDTTHNELGGVCNENLDSI